MVITSESVTKEFLFANEGDVCKTKSIRRPIIICLPTKIAYVNLKE